MTAGGDDNDPPRSGGPRGPITDSMKAPLAKRFYKAASVSAAAPFQVLLDGRPVKTPAKRPLALPTQALAEALATEWNAQADNIDPATMPMTRLANSAIDGVTGNMHAVAQDITAYAGSDLVCYRAETPVELTSLQDRHWNPVLAWARDTLKARFVVAAGVMPVAQPHQALDPIAEALSPHDPFRLAALHVLTTLTGSALLALAHDRGVLTADEAWAAAHVDEDYQISLWGEDAEAASRRRARRVEFDAASRLLTLLVQSRGEQRRPGR